MSGRIVVACVTNPSRDDVFWEAMRFQEPRNPKAKRLRARLFREDRVRTTSEAYSLLVQYANRLPGWTDDGRVIAVSARQKPSFVASAPLPLTKQQLNTLEAWYANPPAGSRLISLTQGLFAVVDEEDYEYLSIYNWQVDRNRWQVAAKRGTTVEGKSVSIRMHREVLGAKRGQLVTHLNGIALDNRRDNLEIATPSRCQIRSRRQRCGASRFRGVHWNVLRRRWVAKITNNGLVTIIGYFEREVDAALAWDKVAINLWGSHARLNFHHRR